MQRHRDGIGGGRVGLRLLAVSCLALVSGCGWLFGDGPAKTQNARPGVDRQGPVTGTLPAASGQHDGGLAPSDPVGNAQVGSIIPAKGGQKAQKEATEKEATEREAKEREERQKREADEREAKAKEQQEEKGVTKATPEKRSLPGKPAAAERGNPQNDDNAGTAPTSAAPASAAPAAAPAMSAPATPAPVTAAPIAPAAPPPPVAPAPEQPAQPPRT